MADPLSITTGIVGLIGFALQGSLALGKAIDGLRTSKKEIRELKKELEAFCVVLQSVHEVAADYHQELRVLELPLRQCGKACQELEKIVTKCVERSGTTFGAYTSLKFRGDSIAKFKDMLAGHKDAITIALSSATFRKSAVTADCVKEWEEMVCCAKSDLEDRLRELDRKLESFSKNASSVDMRGETEWQQLQEEKQSTEQCLMICTKFYEHIEKVGSQVETCPEPDKSNAGVSVNMQYRAKQALCNLLRDFKSDLATTSSEFNNIIERLEHQQTVLPSRPAHISGKNAAAMQQIQEERNSTAQCLTICADATKHSEEIQSNIFEDITSGHDSQQYVISSIGQLITAKRINTGSRSLLMLGQMSDDTIRQSSHDHVLSSEILAKQMSKHMEPTGFDNFQRRYGVGHQLKAEEIELTQKFGRMSTD
ncbi:unnamed protein product [Penicillium salamii]|uniref:Azaphilone pigments biosynthesis cluster protein L N-terminal domain-containing protein n=1 Tax=Penicillium salamii TaxID=1612424 RepID=A0A9W4JDX3_9EURO|nr:unnamed protein product [Penicillium salamii]CAG8208868.1 unnamed protein product [Penicillium salamii]CAG8386310.1 unnamed protein product [Penicillium salamii]CAG8391169.1 unnamed protein product [Penicillium salamii]CAG8393630.1 unnamed protein product [Penicillium salamii]